MNFFDFPFWQNFVSNLLATIIGVALGIPVAFWINRQVEMTTEREKKEKILVALKGELDRIHQKIDEWIPTLQTAENPFRRKMLLGPALYDEIWRSFSDGGELQWIKDPFLLSQLADTYATIGQAKVLSSQLFNIYINGTQASDFLLYSVADRLSELLFQIHKETGDHSERISEQVKNTE